MKSILVTGAAGFLGSHLCERLLNEGHTVYGLDNLLTGSEQNLDILRQYPLFKFQIHDVKEPFPFDVRIEQVYHLACAASPKFYQARPIDTLMTNALGTYNALEFAKQKNARTLLASTSEIYGEPEVHPQKESYWGNVNPVGIRSCYDEGKRFAEAMGFEYWHFLGQDVRIARIFNTYGPRMNEGDGRVIPNFACQAITGSPLTVYGNGSQTRSFCYVDDIIEGFIRILFAEDKAGAIYNLGNPQELSIGDLAKAVINATDSSSGITYKDQPLDDPTRRRPDVSKILSELEWEPKVSLDDGLRATIKYYQDTGIVQRGDSS